MGFCCSDKGCLICGWIASGSDATGTPTGVDGWCASLTSSEGVFAGAEMSLSCEIPRHVQGAYQADPCACNVSSRRGGRSIGEIRGGWAVSLAVAINSVCDASSTDGGTALATCLDMPFGDSGPQVTPFAGPSLVGASVDFSVDTQPR